jgi:uncharacterized phage-associated protein
MPSALEVARYFLAKADEEDELLSHLKLQKLLYYAQGFYLAIIEHPLFPEQILAWEHGPVVREVWDAYKQCAGSGIPAPDDVPTFDLDTEMILDDVWCVYGQFSAWRLREMSHETTPWANAERNAVIPNAAMEQFFKTQMIEA